MRTDPLQPWCGLNMKFSKAELDVFTASTYMVVGDGTSTLFWDDRWVDGQSIKEIAPKVYALIPKHRRRKRTLQHALVARNWISNIVGAPSALALWQYVQTQGHSTIDGAG
jgi:hypothetical protein